MSYIERKKIRCKVLPIICLCTSESNLNKFCGISLCIGSCFCICGVYIFKWVLNAAYIPQCFCSSCFEIGMAPHLIYVDAWVISTLSIEQSLGHVKLVFSFVNLFCGYMQVLMYYMNTGRTEGNLGDGVFSYHKLQGH